MGGWLQIRSKIVFRWVMQTETPPGSPPRETEEPKPGSVSTVCRRPSRQFFTVGKRIPLPWAGGWTRALQVRAATAGGFREAGTPEPQVREGRATTGTECRGGGADDAPGKAKIPALSGPGT